jgi:hypothetical protein
VAPILWAGSLAWGALAARHSVRPRLASLAVAATGMMIGSFMFGEQSERFAATAAVISAAMIVAFALSDRSWPLVALGVFAFFISTVSLMQVVLHGMLARLVAVMVGLAVVGAVAIRAQRMRRPRAGPTRS